MSMNVLVTQDMLQIILGIVKVRIFSMMTLYTLAEFFYHDNF